MRYVHQFLAVWSVFSFFARKCVPFSEIGNSSAKHFSIKCLIRKCLKAHSLLFYMYWLLLNHCLSSGLVFDDLGEFLKNDLWLLLISRRVWDIWWGYFLSKAAGPYRGDPRGELPVGVRRLAVD